MTSAADNLGVTVSVPATTANLGPGFDCLGLALDLRNEFILERSAEDVSFGDHETEYTIEASGIDADKIPLDRSNLVIEATETLFGLINRRPKSLTLRFSNHIPVGSGLGSSSTAIIAGLAGGNALYKSPVPQEELLRIAVEMEGHPDNVAPAMLGGLVLGVLPDDGQGPAGLVIHRWEPPDVSAVVVLPDFRLLTSEARAVLPAVIPRADAIFNISRFGLLLHAFTSGDFTWLGAAMGDRLHQPYRLKIIPGAIDAYNSAVAHGALGVALSGAGPSLIALARENHQDIAAAMVKAFQSAGLDCRVWHLAPSSQGVRIAHNTEIAIDPDNHPNKRLISFKI